MWLKAFLNNRAGALRITYLVSAFKIFGKEVRIVGEACVYGMGAYLMIDDIIVSWYATALSNHDEKLLNVQIGDEKHQQVAESLNLLVALRTWKQHWCLERVQLEVRADNMTALNLILRLKGSTPQLNQIAREVALDLGHAAFRPDIVSHTPGIASTMADDLSRRFCPGTVFKLPTAGERARSTRTSCFPCFSHVFITSRNSVRVLWW